MLRVAALLGLAVRHRLRLRKVPRALCQRHSPPHPQVGKGSRSGRLLQEEGIIYILQYYCHLCPEIENIVNYGTKEAWGSRLGVSVSVQMVYIWCKR